MYLYVSSYVDTAAIDHSVLGDLDANPAKHASGEERQATGAV